MADCKSVSGNKTVGVHIPASCMLVGQNSLEGPSNSEVQSRQQAWEPGMQGQHMMEQSRQGQSTWEQECTVEPVAQGQ